MSLRRSNLWMLKLRGLFSARLRQRFTAIGILCVLTICSLNRAAEKEEVIDTLSFLPLRIHPSLYLSPTLVMYVFARDCNISEANLNYFLQHGISNRSSYTYLIVIQDGATSSDAWPKLPKVPPNVRFVSHPNECFDVGTVGWLLFESGEVQVSHYDFFVWLNPSVRGPFVPTWMDSSEWPLLFTSKINSTIKLSGTVLSCGGIADEILGERINPHLQSYLLATDTVGLGVLQKENVFRCYKRYTEVIYFGEVGASLAILQAGYNIHSAMLRYKEVDWRNRDTWNCNRGTSPIIPGQNDGISIDPLEVMFVKVKEKQLSWESTVRALKYTDMSGYPSSMCLTCNAAVDDTSKSKKIRRNVEKLRPFFKFSYYVMASRDLKTLRPNELWEHFAASGLSERRPFALERTGRYKEFPLGADSFEQIVDSFFNLC